MKKLTILLILMPQIAFADMFLALGAGRFEKNQAIPTSFIGSAELGVRFNSLVLSAQAYHIKQDVRPMNRGGALKEGTITMVPIFVNIGTQMPVSESLRFNVSGGIGYVSPDKTIHPILAGRWELMNREVKEEIDPGMAFQIKGGLETKVSNRIAVSFDVGYIIFNTNARFIRKNNNILNDIRYVDEFHVDLGSIIGMITTRFYF